MKWQHITIAGLGAVAMLGLVIACGSEAVAPEPICVPDTIFVTDTVRTFITDTVTVSDTVTVPIGALGVDIAITDTLGNPLGDTVTAGEYFWVNVLGTPPADEVGLNIYIDGQWAVSSAAENLDGGIVSILLVASGSFTFTVSGYALSDDSFGRAEMTAYAVETTGGGSPDAIPRLQRVR